MTRRLVAVALVTLAGCAGMLGLDDYRSAAVDLCACPDLAAIPRCVETTEQRLDDATPGDRADWLAAYESTCDGKCDAALECYGIAPVCTPWETACTTSRECCGYTRGSGCCAALDGATCCSDCATCGEALAGPGTGASPCLDSLPLYEALFACICDQCPTACKASCPSFGRGQVGLACSQCIKDKAGKAGSACYGELIACVADQPANFE